jgi:hypothetical protein
LNVRAFGGRKLSFDDLGDDLGDQKILTAELAEKGREGRKETDAGFLALHFGVNWASS